MAKSKTRAKRTPKSKARSYRLLRAKAADELLTGTYVVETTSTVRRIIFEMKRNGVVEVSVNMSCTPPIADGLRDGLTQLMSVVGPSVMASLGFAGGFAAAGMQPPDAQPEPEACGDTERPDCSGNAKAETGDAESN